MRFVIYTLITVYTGLIAVAQTNTSMIADVGYLAPASKVVRVSPGQILTLFVSGVQPSTDKPITARSIPVATTLAGLTVELNIQSGSAPHTLPVPILAVAPRFSPCPLGGDPNCTLTWITVQIPYEIGATIPGESGSFPPPVAISVTDGTNTSTTVLASPVYDQIHVLGDDVIRASLNAALGRTSINGPAITHADGSQVTASNPAIPGELLVMYAVGLGIAGTGVAGMVKAGEGSPSPPVSRTGLAMRYDYTANAAPSSSGFVSDLGFIDSSVRFAGLTPGLVGLWQVNFVLPPPPGPIAGCAPPIMSNLTITLTGTTSFDGAGICVSNEAK